jgi:hypothetical protein
VLLGSLGKEQIWNNSGQGWNLLQEAAKEGDRKQLSGFADGALVKFGSFGCGVSFVEGDRETCAIALGDVNGFFGVRPDRAYASHSDLVLVFDGAYFQQLGAPLGASGTLSAKQLWADDSSLLVATSRGVYERSSPTQPLQLESNLPVTSYESVWQAPGGTRFAGSATGELWREIGEGWELAWQDACSEPVSQLWSTGDYLFFATRHTLGRHYRDGAHSIQDWPCASNVTITGLWGNSLSEVYVAVVDESLEDSDCGAAVVLRYDGASLQRL